MIYGAIAVAILILLAVQNANASTGSDNNETIMGMIRRVALERGVDPALMLAIAKQESNFDPSAINPSDPSYGLFQIQSFWLQYFGHDPADIEQLFNAAFATGVACEIILYFQNKGFTFPQQVDIYNVGETLWRDGRRNAAYRDAVNRFYNEFSTL